MKTKQPQAQRALLRQRSLCLMLAAVMTAGSLPLPVLAASAGSPASAATATPGLPAPVPVAGDPYVFTFKQLGRNGSMNLHGVDATDSLNFDVPVSLVTTGAHVTLYYTYSPALLPDLSQINVMVNDVVAGSIPLPKEGSGSMQTAKVDIPPKLITEFNRLSLQFIGHYTMGCEDPLHSSLWARVANGSTLDLQTTPLPQKDDLAQMPLPFFDRRDIRMLSLPFVFAGNPDNGTLEAAGTLSSWFGALAAYRGARFPVQINALPPRGNAVVMVAGEAPTSVAGLEVAAPKGPTLTVLPNPNDANGKLLVVSGRNVGELRQAAAALALGSKGLSGSSAVIDKLQPLAPRQPYDAPNWLPTDRAVKLSELIDPKRLNVSGYNPGEITIPLNFPPALSNWRQDGAKLKLVYRYTPQPKSTNSSFLVSFNDGLIKSDILLPKDKLDKSLLASIKDEALTREMDLRLPLNLAGPQSRLQLRYMYDFVKQGECQDIIIDNVRGSIDPDSTIDLRGYDHFMAMPNLGVFKDAGFPFTRMADLSESAVVLPDNASTDDLAAYLTLLGRFGSATGYPATGVVVTQAAQVDKVASRDLLVLASGQNQPLLKQWADHLPAAVTGDKQRFDVGDFALRVRSWLKLADDDQAKRRARLALAFTGGEPTSYLTGFESPLDSGRSVVVLAGGDATGLDQILAAMASKDPEAETIQGSLVAVRGTTIDPLLAEEQYFTGSMSPLRMLRWWLSRHVLAMFVLIAGGILMLGGLAYLTLRAKARKRLNA
ncbi:cyclic di-GMP binding protein WssC [Herbaspirillum sp. GW103]|uniref:cellulose biosynthesis cyclic di-GMP-binding regulatory protein BcsB n=1 Tax=unclassified Herbaspirillum TaxID=2624150 RepID=UPI00025E3208|nr:MULTISPECIES: cellulose biosynthesis cyclic di-GMP-binding regulatory protein BcsB [unclassified Herbaspirillum]EIJ48660.1 cyclic di-GMP binding protein WssC [Herbaspirillum sp. GW103]MCI1007136.1 cellulose biosynthesis cyclic di-GMP-binding regulatory protein BcsB [Herbaspirillum sp. C7C8]